MVSHEFPPLETDGGMLKEEEHRNAMVAHAQEAAEASLLREGGPLARPAVPVAGRRRKHVDSGQPEWHGGGWRAWLVGQGRH